MVDSHIIEKHTLTFRRPDQHQFINVTAHVPREDHLSRYYDLHFLNNYHNWNESPNGIDTKNSGANIARTNFENQEHQNFYD